MVQISQYHFIRRLRADTSSHIQLYRGGRRVRSGRGLAFWFLPDGASISHVPMDDRELPFLLKGQSSDYQDLTVQGNIIWRATQPEVLSDRIDFTVDLLTGAHRGEPVDQVNNVLITLARQFAHGYLNNKTVRTLLEGGVAPLQATMLEAFRADSTLEDLGLELVSLSVSGLAPTSELARALQTPTFESLQQQADEATFARRALAVEKERAIAENELANKIELTSREKELIALEDANTRSQAEAMAAAERIQADAEADKIRSVEGARGQMERERLAVYGELPPATLMAMAVRDFAGKLERIDSVTVTPDMLAGLVSQLRGAVEPEQKPREPAE